MSTPELGDNRIQWASLVAQMVKNLPALQETQFQSLGQQDRLEKGMATHSSNLVWSPWTEEPGALYSTWGLKRVRHKWATKTFTLGFPGGISGEERACQWRRHAPACKIPRTEEPGGLQLEGHKELDKTEMTTHTCRMWTSWGHVLYIGDVSQFQWHPPSVLRDTPF